MKSSNKWLMAFSAIVLAASVAGCAGSYDRQVEGLASYAKRHKIGGSADFYLVKNGMAGPDRVALVFGMGDDFSFCMELAELYTQKYPSDTYWCEAANG